MLDPVAIRIDYRWRDALFAFIGAKHNADHAGFGLFANELRLRPIIQITQNPHDWRTPWHAPSLGSLLLVEMGDVAGRDRQAVEPASRCDDRIARVLRIEPIGSPLTEAIELHPLDDPPAIDEVTVAAGVQHISFEQLQLQGYVEPITCPARSAPD